MELNVIYSILGFIGEFLLSDKIMLNNQFLGNFFFIYILLTPMCLKIIGILIININSKLFFEIPNIFLGSLGLTMYRLRSLL